MMEKIMSNFNVDNNLSKGNGVKTIVCPYCKQNNKIKTINKLRMSKLHTIICKKCKRAIMIGDIYNFRNGKKLNDLLINHNQELYDKKEWNNNYDKI